MRKHWVTAVSVVGLALATTASAWADCDVQMVLKQQAGPTGVTGTAEKKVVTANPLLNIRARNQFGVDVANGGTFSHYDVMVKSDPLGSLTRVGGFVTDAGGNGDFDLRGQSFTCSITAVAVVKTITGKTVLSGQFGALNNQVENEAQVEVEAHNEIQNEIQVEIQNEAQPHP